MTEAMMVEAVRAVGVNQGAQLQQAVQAVADPNAIAQFEAAMGTAPVTDIPFAQQVSGVWKSAQLEHQDHLHRLASLSELSAAGQLSALQMTSIQYELMCTSFQLEIVTNVSKKASDAVSTLVKNG